MKLLPAFIPLLALLGACATKPAAMTARGLFPLEVGRYWIYQLDGDKQKTVKNSIASTLTIGETQWFESIEFGEKFWIRNGDEGQMEAVNLYTKDENAAIFEKIDPKVIHEELMFKFPARPGDTWTTLENLISYEGIETLTVPAGDFSCHMYSIAQYGQTYSHSCIAEGIGVVYSDNILPDGKKEISRLLEWSKK